MVDAVSKILKSDGGSNPTYRFMLKNNSTTLGSNGIPARDPMYSIAFFVSFVGNIEFFVTVQRTTENAKFVEIAVG